MKVPKIKNRKRRMYHQEVYLDSKMGRRPICRCLFAVRGYIREVNNLRASICTSVIVHQEHLAVLLLGI